jgi:hypothetical protein
MSYAKVVRPRKELAVAQSEIDAVRALLKTPSGRLAGAPASHRGSRVGLAGRKRHPA